MTKSHEETWIVDQQTGHLVTDNPEREWVGDFCEFGVKAPPGFQPVEQDRAKLASQAPAMARILERLVGDAAVNRPLAHELSPELDEMKAVLRAAGVLQ
jgi:hypothetical protein